MIELLALNIEKEQLRKMIDRLEDKYEEICFKIDAEEERIALSERGELVASIR